MNGTDDHEPAGSEELVPAGTSITRMPAGVIRKVAESARPNIDLMAIFDSGVGYLERETLKLLEQGYREGRTVVFVAGSRAGEIRIPEAFREPIACLPEAVRREFLMKMMRHLDELDPDLVNNPRAFEDAEPQLSAAEVLALTYDSIRLFGMEDPVFLAEQQRIAMECPGGSEDFWGVVRLRARRMIEEIVAQVDRLTGGRTEAIRVTAVNTRAFMLPFHELADARRMRYKWYSVG